jgi:hypothetical protein
LGLGVAVGATVGTDVGTGANVNVGVGSDVGSGGTVGTALGSGGIVGTAVGSGGTVGLALGNSDATGLADATGAQLAAGSTPLSTAVPASSAWIRDSIVHPVAGATPVTLTHSCSVTGDDEGTGTGDGDTDADIDGDADSRLGSAEARASVGSADTVAAGDRKTGDPRTILGVGDPPAGPWAATPCPNHEITKTTLRPSGTNGTRRRILPSPGRALQDQ